MHASTMHRPAHWSDAWMPACAGMTVEGAKRSGAQHAPPHTGAKLTAWEIATFSSSLPRRREPGSHHVAPMHAPSHAGARLTAPACAWAAARRRAKPCRSLAV